MLARNYWNIRDVVALIQDAGISPGEVNLTGPTDTVWRNVLDTARRKDLLRALLRKVAERDVALKPKLGELLADSPVTSAPAPAPAPADMDWVGFDPTGVDEKQIVAGFPTLLGIAFLAEGLRLAASVCRFNTVLSGGRFNGTGFRIGDDLLLTNHHVLHDWTRGDVPATSVDVWFNYELGWDKSFRQHRVVACRADSIVGERDHDWAVVRTAEPIPNEFPMLPLDKLGVPPVADDRVYIIQHPNGEPKMIGMDHNLVRHVDDELIQYWTDTEQGSSGSPVFDDEWRLVGLHHRAVRVDRQGKPPEFRNQGRRMSKVVERMASFGLR